MYVNGQGVKKDYQKAIKLFKPAAEQGYAPAQNNLGYMYQKGYGVTQDYIRAYMWLDFAASQGDKNAKVNLKKIEKKMDYAQDRKAKELAQECITKNYRDC